MTTPTTTANAQAPDWLNGLRRWVHRRLRQSPAVTITASDGPTSPGFYALYYRGNNSLYREHSATHPIYVGATGNLRQRLADHAKSLSEVTNLDVADFTVRTVPSPHLGTERAAERLLIDRWDPPWNRSTYAGFGSRNQGANRKDQRLSAWDRLHPGRHWTRRPAA